MSATVGGAAAGSAASAVGGSVESGGPTESVGPPGRRMPADERRAQLVGIGVRLLSDRPIHELSLDEVASAAGISRSLLFHYFPTKGDYYVEVVRAAGQRLLRPPRVPPGANARDRISALVTGYLRLVARTPSYRALVSGAAGGDPRVVVIIDELRTALVPRWLAAADAPSDDPLTVVMVRGWLVSLEEVALAVASRGSPGTGSVDRDRLVEVLVGSFFDLLQRCAGEGARSAH